MAILFEHPAGDESWMSIDMRRTQAPESSWAGLDLVIIGNCLGLISCRMCMNHRLDAVVRLQPVVCGFEEAVDAVGRPEGFSDSFSA